ncbi:uncharacterized protein HKW66_Vig0033880 [Vigna angularis]|uniref:Uncharacterized protein n=1 Tax=Phaseolus angularis TaxID=3914 RepID=A0A8T0L9A1_PHAAN|nr:uncharacterized protein HKW66_Vig0033880 [Vigna angularis]
MALSDDAQHHSPSILDALLCEERDTFDENFDANDAECEINDDDPSGRKLQYFPLALLQNDLYWEDEELVIPSRE